MASVFRRHALAVKHVAQVALAVLADNFCARHAESRIVVTLDSSCNFIVKARPTTV